MKKFLGRKKSPNPPADDNPYAQEPANDPYAYQNSNEKVLVGNPGGLPSGPRGGRPGVGLPGGPRGGNPSPANSMSGPSPSYRQQAPPPQQQQQQNSGYGNERYGAAGGYGSSNRYGDSNPYGGGGARGPQGDNSAGGRRPGGYGGLGGADADDSREALFGGAKERVQNPAPGGPGRAPPAGGAYGGAPGGGYAAAGGYGGGPDGATGNKYGGYGEERELTEEEQMKLEERELARQVDQERDATVDTGHRILGIINNTIETANGTLQNMAQQDERLRNTERNLDLADIHNRTAQEKTKELKHYNRSLWNPGNPFMAKSKKEQRERKFMEEQERDRERREETLRDAHQSQAKYERDMREIQDTMDNRRALGLSSTQAAANNNRFVFDESDEEDDNPENQALRADRRAKEDEINNVIMPGMETGVATLNQIARTFKGRIDESNALIDRIGDKSDTVDNGVRVNRRKLDDILR